MHADAEIMLRVPDQNGISQACYIVEIYRSGPEPLMYNTCSTGDKYSDWPPTHINSLLCPPNRLAGLVAKASTSRADGPGFESRLRRDFSGVESYQWLENWHSSGYPAKRLTFYRVSAGTGWPGVSILRLGETESLICNFYLSEAACKIV